MMDLDASLTPPKSPITSDDGDIQIGSSSPVLIGKTRKRPGFFRSDASVREQTCTNYTDHMKCQPSVKGKSSYEEIHNENSVIASASESWRKTPTVRVVGEFHDCSRCRRSIMDQKYCLNDLCSLETAQDIFYQVMMYLQDMEEIVMKQKRHAYAQTTLDADLTKKCYRYVYEAMLFVSEFVENCQKDTNTADTLINIFDLMMMVSNASHSSILDSVKHLVMQDLDNQQLGRKVWDPIYHWSHSCIYIQATLLKLLPHLCKQGSVMHHIESSRIGSGKNAETSKTGFCHEFINRILSLSLVIALEKYNQLKQTYKTDRKTCMQALFLRSSSLPCQCMQELFSLCRLTAAQVEWNKQTMQSATDSFNTQTSDCSKEKLLENCNLVVWRMISVYVDDKILKNVQEKKSHDGPVRDSAFHNFSSTGAALSFCWWWTWDVARLFYFNECGKYMVGTVSAAYLPLLSKLVRKMLSCYDGDLEQISYHLNSYKMIVALWRRNSSHPEKPFQEEFGHFRLLWAHFSKKMNMAKTSDSFGIRKYVTVDDKNLTPQKWIEKCNMCLERSENLNEESNFVLSNPFSAFLSIFGEILSLGCWKDVKESCKFFSRMQLTDMKTLTDNGLIHLYQLFLLIVSSDINNSERLDVFGKLTKFLSVISITRSDYGKMKIMLNGLFSCMRVSILHSVKLEAIAKHCTSIMTSVLRMFSDSGRNAEQRNSLWGVVKFYLQNLTDIYQLSSSFHLCQDMLLPPESARQYLCTVKCSETVTVLENITIIFSTLRVHIELGTSAEKFTSCMSVITTLFNFFLPWLRIISKTEDNASEDIVNLLLEWCDVLIKIGNAKFSVIFPIKLSKLLSDFCTSVSVKMQIRSQFLVRILSGENQELIDILNGTNIESVHSRTAVIQGILKCIVCQPRNELRDRLVRSMGNIDVIQDVLRCQEPRSNDCFNDFLMALKQKLNSTQEIDRRKLQVQVLEWFSPISEVFSSSANIRLREDPQLMMNVYKTCASIVKTCGEIFYVLGNHGLVRQVFDVLVLPRSTYEPKGKEMHSALVNALNRTLHIFVESLLDLNRGDAYIQRVLRDIVNNYLTRFPTGTNATWTSHPFTRVLLSKDVSACQRAVFVELLDNHCRSTQDINASMNAVISVLHAWAVMPGKTFVEFDETPSMRAILSRGKSNSRSEATRRKAEFIYGKLRASTKS